jgi:DNA-binding MarR family transcriptional regulator
MTRATSDQAVQVWEVISRAHCSMTAALEKDLLPQTGLQLGWYQVLSHLSQAPGSMLRFQDLARVAGITDSGASRRLNQMIKAGLIDRHSCPTDRRGVYAHLTDQGLAAYGKAHAVFIRSLERNLASRLQPSEADAVHAALARIVEPPRAEA